MYRTINDSIWSEPWFEDLSAAGRLTFLYLLTSPRQTPCGVLEITVGRISQETALDASEIGSALRELEGVGKIRWWPEQRFVWVCRFYRWQRASSSANYEIAARKAAACLPDNIRLSLYQEYPELATPLHTHPQPIPNPSPTLGDKETATVTATAVETATAEVTESRARPAPAKPPEPSPAATPRTPPDLRKPKERERGWIERHPLWPAVTDIFGRPASSQWSSVAASLRDLDELGATDSEVRRRAEIYPAVMGTGSDGTPILMTLRALVKHWPACARAPTPPAAKPSRYSAHHIDPDLAVARLEAALNGGPNHAQSNRTPPGSRIVPGVVAASLPGSGDL